MKLGNETCKYGSDTELQTYYWCMMAMPLNKIPNCFFCNCQESLSLFIDCETGKAIIPPNTSNSSHGKFDPDCPEMFGSTCVDCDFTTCKACGGAGYTINAATGQCYFNGKPEHIKYKI